MRHAANGASGDVDGDATRKKKTDSGLQCSQPAIRDWQ
jgi:hypothetical protein